MSDLSIDEIIKRAEEIKAEAERQLASAEKNLNEKAKTAIEEVVVDEEKVLEKITEATAEKEEEIKVFPPKIKSSILQKAVRIEDEDDEEEDIIIAKDYSSKPKIKPIPIEDEDDDIKLVDNQKTGPFDLSKTKPVGIKRKIEEKTKPIIVSKTERDEATDLESIPTIVSKEHLFEDKQSEFDEDVGVQMTFEGFDDELETIPTIDEDLAEQILKERRRNKVDKFRVFGPSETDADLGNENIVDEDYEDENEKADFIKGLLRRKKSLNKQLAITSAIGLLLILLAWIETKPFAPFFLTYHYVYYTLALALYLGAIATNFNVIIHGFNFKQKINSDFPISLTVIIILIHTLALTFSQALCIDNGILLAPIGTFALFLSQLGKRQMMIRIIDNFNFITDGDEKYTIENITNAVDAEIISRGTVETEPIIKTSVKTDFPTNFLEISCKAEPADKVSKIIFLVSLGLNLILFVVIGLLDNFNTGFNVAMCGLAITVPAVAIFMTNMMLTEVSHSLDKFGSRVCGVEGAVMADDANAMVMEAADLFTKDCCKLHGIKTLSDSKVDDAIINAAAVIVQTKSPLASVFDDVIIGKQSILPPVDDILYEDKMGTSAWIYDKRVLVGNRDLLVHHGVQVPKESVEQKYTIKGRKALYLAIDGQAIAMFVVSYKAEPKLKRELKKLEKSGIQIIVKSSDPHINEESIAKLFGLPEGYISVMNYSSARVFEKYSGMHVEKSPAYVVHNGSALGFVSAMHGAEIIVSSYHLVTFLESFGAVLGFLAVALLSAIQAYNELSAVNIMAFQVIWSGFMMIVAKLRGKTL